MVKKIELTQGKFAIVDEEDFEKVNKLKWYASKSVYNDNKFYARSTQNKKTIRMHRFILGVIDSKIFVDHINGDTLDNRKENLRLCTQAENSKNRKLNDNNKFGVKGVTKITGSKYKPYTVRIHVDNKDIYVGAFSTLEEAGKAYDHAALKYFGEFAKTNYETTKKKK